MDKKNIKHSDGNKNIAEIGILETIRKTFIERWPFYLIGYVIGYLVSLKITGVPNAIYLIPIKLYAVLLALVIGTAIYHGFKKTPFISSKIRFFKYLIIIMIIIIISEVLYRFLLLSGIDISPFIGM